MLKPNNHHIKSDLWHKIIVLITVLLISSVSHHSLAQQRQTSSVSVSGYAPATGHHINEKTIEFSYELLDFPVGSFPLSSRITNSSAVGFAVDGQLYKPSPEYASWNNFLSDCSSTTYVISGFVVINGRRFAFTNTALHAAPGFTTTGQIEFDQEMEVQNVRFENVEITGVDPSAVNGPAQTFKRWLKAQSEK